MFVFVKKKKKFSNKIFFFSCLYLWYVYVYVYVDIYVTLFNNSFLLFDTRRCQPVELQGFWF